MDVTVGSSSVSGTARAPPSKSYTHRAILAAGYAEETTVRGPLISADTRATIRAVDAFGGVVDGVDTVVAGKGNAIQVIGTSGDLDVPADVIDCANSGTTMRLVTAASALVDGLVVLTGDASLRSRPHGPLLDAIADLDGRAESTRRNGQAPLVVGGPLDGGTVRLPGDVSSQFVTALLMAGPLTRSGIEIELTTPLKSAPYVDITRDVLAAFSVDTTETDSGFAVPGDQPYRAAGGQYTVPGDFSSASYLLAAGALAGSDSVVVSGLYPSVQGDAAIIEVLREMGADVRWDRDAGRVRIASSQLRGVQVDVGDTPDLLPTIAVLGAAADGETRIVNAEHVRYKETDRVSAMAEALDELGAVVDERPDELHINGRDSRLEGTTLDGRGDHRIVMALTVAGLVADGRTTISGAEHVDVSFPGFFATLRDLGARIDGADPEPD